MKTKFAFLITTTARTNPPALFQPALSTPQLQSFGCSLIQAGQAGATAKVTENGGNENFPSFVVFPATGILPMACPSVSKTGNCTPFSNEVDPNTPGGSSGTGAPLRPSRSLVAALGSADSVQYVYEFWSTASVALCCVFALEASVIVLASCQQQGSMDVTNRYNFHPRWRNAPSR